MAQKDYSKLADDIIENVGGKENVNTVIHCITRLRFYLNDEKKANTEKISSLDGVAGAVYNEALGQYQVVIGPAVTDVYDEVITKLGDEVVDEEATNAAVAATGGASQPEKPKSAWDGFLERFNY